MEKNAVQNVHYSNHHLIYGAGLIGCYLGGAFDFAQQNVQLVVREKTKLQLANHYEITDYKGNQHQILNSITMLEESELGQTDLNPDFLWFCVKCTSIEDAIPSLHHCVGENTVILCCQNGVNNHLAVRQAFPHHKVIRAMVPFNVVNEKDGHFHRGSEGHLVLESIPELQESIKWLSSQIASKHLPVDISYDMTSLQWAKLQLNLGNAVNALADIPVKTMLETKDYRLFIANAMRELLKITRKKQIKLPKIANVPNKWIPMVLSLPDGLFRLLAQKMLAIDPKVRTSMWWDLAAGRHTEIDFLNQKVVEEAQKLGIDTPFNTFIVDTIKLSENGKRPAANDFLAQVTAMNQEANT